jgi:hypothetical protein
VTARSQLRPTYGAEGRDVVFRHDLSLYEGTSRAVHFWGCSDGPPFPIVVSGTRVTLRGIAAGRPAHRFAHFGKGGSGGYINATWAQSPNR